MNVALLEGLHPEEPFPVDEDQRAGVAWRLGTVAKAEWPVALVLRDAGLVTRTARLCHRRGDQRFSAGVIRYLSYWAPQADADGMLPLLPERVRLGRYQRRTGRKSSTFYADQSATESAGVIEQVQAASPGYGARYRLRLVPELVPADPPPGLARDLAAGWEQERGRLAEDLAQHTILLRPGSPVLVDAVGVVRPRAAQLDGVVVRPVPKRIAQELAHVRRTGRVHRRVKGRLKAVLRSVDAVLQSVPPPGGSGPEWIRFQPLANPARPLPKSGPYWFENPQLESSFSTDRLEASSLYKKEGPVILTIDPETTVCCALENCPTPHGDRHLSHAREARKPWKNQKGRGKGPRGGSAAISASVSPFAMALMTDVMAMWRAELGPSRTLWARDAYDVAHIVPGHPICGMDRGSALRLARLIDSTLERSTPAELVDEARAAGASSADQPVRTWAQRMRRIGRTRDRVQYRPIPTTAVAEHVDVRCQARYATEVYASTVMMFGLPNPAPVEVAEERRRREAARHERDAAQAAIVAEEERRRQAFYNLIGLPLPEQAGARQDEAVHQAETAHLQELAEPPRTKAQIYAAAEAMARRLRREKKAGR